MARYTATVRDPNEAPVPGAFVAVSDYKGALANLTDDSGNPLPNPFHADELGGININASDGQYNFDYHYPSGHLIRRDYGVVIGTIFAAVNPSPENAGKYIALDANGNAIPASGTGNDPALRTDLAAPTGASLTGFLQSGDDAVTRDVQSELRDTYSVKQFGAAGDGVTDDTAAILAAITAAGSNNTIYFPAGLYVVSSQIAVDSLSNITFLGEGARIKGTLTRFRSYFKLTNCSRVTFTALSFDQMQSSLPVYTSADYASEIYNCPIELQTCGRVTVQQCSFDNLYTSAIFAKDSSDIVVMDNIFTSPVQAQMLLPSTLGGQWLQHVHFLTCGGIVVSNNRFMNAVITNPANGVCSVYASGISRYAIISGNYTEYGGRDNTGTHRLGVIDFYGDAQTVRIVNNVSLNGMAQFSRVSAVQGALIEGNRIHASTNAELDYSMVTLEGSVAFGGQKGILDNIVRNNLLEDPAQRHAFAIGAISYDWGVPSIHTQIEGNGFLGCRVAVLVRGPNRDTRIVRNHMRGAGAGTILCDQQTSITSTYGTEADSTFYGLEIAHNYKEDGSSTNSTAIVVDLTKSPAYTGHIDHVSVQGNVLRSTATNAAQGISINLGHKGHSSVENNEVYNYAIGIYLRDALIASLRNNRMVSCASPITDEASAGAVDRHDNRYTAGVLSGQATLAAGTISVATTEVQSGDTIILSRQTASGTTGDLSIGAITAGTSFTIVSTSNLDTSAVNWRIDH